MIKRKSSLSEAPSDATVREGWENLDIKWLVTEDILGSKYACFGRVVYAPGGRALHRTHIHPNAEEFLYVIRGRLEYIVEGETITLGPEEFIYVPPNTRHSCRNVSPTEICEAIWSYAGAPSWEKAGEIAKE